MRYIFYNLTKKTYPDGTIQYMYSENIIRRGNSKRQLFEYDGSSVEKKEKENSVRAMRRVFDLARANTWDYFVTLTFNPNKVDRYDYDSCADCLKKFTKWAGKNKTKWLMVAEQCKDGAYHFHGLINGSLKLTHFKGDIYNLANFDWGYTTVTKVKSHVRVSTYISKYISKCFSVPKGRKRFWASRNLIEPTIDYTEISLEEFSELFNTSDYSKVITSDYGKFLLCEVHGDEKAENKKQK